MHDATQTKDLYRFGQRELDQLFRHPFRKTAVRLSCAIRVSVASLDFYFSVQGADVSNFLNPTTRTTEHYT